MEILSYFALVFTVPNLIAAVLGTMVGIILGALPGCTPSLGLAIFIPITYTMDPATALIYLGSIYAGGMYGGTITAILINVPGTAAAAAATIDGFKMTKHGLSLIHIEMCIRDRRYSHPVEKLYSRELPVEKDKELILIPTTCGTGSEMTNISILALIEKQTKMGLAMDELCLLYTSAEFMTRIMAALIRTVYV